MKSAIYGHLQTHKRACLKKGVMKALMRLVAFSQEQARAPDPSRRCG